MQRQNDKSILVVGGSGQIGGRLLSLLSESGHTAVGTYFKSPKPGLRQLDSSDANQVAELFAQTEPSVVVNAVNAQGGTDACELDPGLAQRFHFDTARNLADGAKSVGAKFVQISTDYVFDGQAGPYKETDTPNPLSRLGKAKLNLENYVLTELPESLVVRTSFVFSWTPQSKTKNFVMQILENYQERRAMQVPIDQVGNVTYAPNFAEALIEMVRLNAAGLYHLAGRTRCSKYDWALQVVEFFGLDSSLIQGVTTQELKQPGPRPLESGFELEKVETILKSTRLLSLGEGLRDMQTKMQACGVQL